MPADEGAGHAHAGTEPDEQHEVAGGQAPGVGGLGQGQRHRCGTGVAVVVDGDDRSGRVEAEALGHRVDDPDVGLVRHEQGDVVDGDPGPGQRAQRRVGRGAHGPTEHLTAVHLDGAADARR